MPIAVTCSCGKKFAAKDALAGKRVKCPECGEPLEIPRPGQTQASKSAKPAAQAPKPAAHHDSVFDEVGLTMRSAGRHDCPECGEEVQPDAVLCVNCGYNFKLGKRIQTLGVTGAAPVRSNQPAKPKTEIDKMLEFAEDELEKEPVKQELGYGSKSSAWMITIVMIAVAAGVLAAMIAFFNYMEGEAAQKAREKQAQEGR